jgi:hypothetical protein
MEHACNKAAFIRIVDRPLQRVETDGEIAKQPRDEITRFCVSCDLRGMLQHMIVNCSILVTADIGIKAPTVDPVVIRALLESATVQYAQPKHDAACSMDESIL